VLASDRSHERFANLIPENWVPEQLKLCIWHYSTICDEKDYLKPGSTALKMRRNFA